MRIFGLDETENTMTSVLSCLYLSRFGNRLAAHPNFFETFSAIRSVFLQFHQVILLELRVNLLVKNLLMKNLFAENLWLASSLNSQQVSFVSKLFMVFRFFLVRLVHALKELFSSSDFVLLESSVRNNVFLVSEQRCMVL